MKKMLYYFLLSIIPAFSIAQKHYLLIGTYTSGKSEGIYVYSFDRNTGDFKPVSKIYTSNPSYMAISPNEKFVYSVNEDQPGMVTAFSFDKMKGQLKQLNSKPSGGDHPCYVTVDKTGKWVIVGNYSGGNLTVLPTNSEGHLEDPVQTMQHEGSSVDLSRQDKPHVHATVFSTDNKSLFVPDLGIDRVMIYSFNNKKGMLSPGRQPFIMTEPGAGPRHFEFHPTGKFAYLVEELTGTVSSYSFSSKYGLQLIQNISALPRDYLGPVGSADIHVSPDGKFLYASNRGESNSLAIFSIDKKAGLLTPVGHQSTLGKKPRNFNFDPSGKFLLVANQDSDEIVIFRRDVNTGLLEDSGKRISVPKPVCIKWINN